MVKLRGGVDRNVHRRGGQERPLACHAVPTAPTGDGAARAHTMSGGIARDVPGSADGCDDSLWCLPRLIAATADAGPGASAAPSINPTGDRRNVGVEGGRVRGGLARRLVRTRCSCHSPSLRPWITETASSWRGLEPGAHRMVGAVLTWAGPRCDSSCWSNEHHLRTEFGQQKGRPVGRPRTGFAGCGALPQVRLYEGGWA